MIKKIIIILISISVANAAEVPGLSAFTAENKNTLVTLGSVDKRSEVLVTLNENGEVINVLLVDKQPLNVKYKEQSLRDINVDGIYDIRLSRLKADDGYDCEIKLDDKWTRVDRLQDNGLSAIVGN